jgi:hypothetical protein
MLSICIPSVFKNSVRLVWYTLRRSKWFLQLVPSPWGVARRCILSVCLAAGCLPLLVCKGRSPETTAGAAIWMRCFRRFVARSRIHLLSFLWRSRKLDRVYYLTLLQHGCWGSWCRQISPEPPESPFGRSHPCWLLLREFTFILESLWLTIYRIAYSCHYSSVEICSFRVFTEVAALWSIILPSV